MAPSHHSLASGLAALAVCALAPGTAAAAVHQRGIVQLPVDTAFRASGAGRLPRLSKRDFTPVNFSGSPVFYTVPASIGTPPQDVSLQLDTGTSDLWVNPDCADPAPFPGSASDCQAAGVYQPSGAATGGPAQFTTGFGPFTGDVTADYYQDTVRVGNLTVPSQPFGVASESHNETYGRLGLGPHPADGFTDSLFLSSAARQGSISSRAFSLYLPSLDEDKQGSLLLGGIDKSKFQGALKALPIIGASEVAEGTWANRVRLDDLSVYLPPQPVAAAYGLPQTLAGGGTAAVLDSGSPALGLPANVTAAVRAQLGADGPSAAAAGGLPLWSVPCGMRGADGFFNFGFGGLEVGVPLGELVLEAAAVGGAAGACYLVVYDSGSEAVVLGAPFLRAAYAVFDWDNQHIHIARSANCGTDVVPIGAGPTAVGSPSGNCTPSPKRRSKRAAAAAGGA